MKKIKDAIIKILEEDCRYPVSQIATMLGESESVIKNLIKEMEDDGVIVKYTAIVDDTKKDDMVEALIEVKVTPQKNMGFDSIAEEIYCFDEVKSLYLMSGAYDLAVFIEGKTLKQIASFVSEKLSTLDTVLSTATHFILKKYKIEGTIVEGKDKGERLMFQP